MNEFLNELNEAQLKAVTSDSGPLLILAGAGSGKTKVLTYRIAYLIKNGLDPAKILAVTFTNKAAGEMKNRVNNLIGDKGKNIWIGTFHSICARILRREIAQLGYSNSFTIYDEQDKKRLIDQCLKDLNYDPKKNPPSAISHIISSAKNELIDSESFGKKALDYKEEIAAEVYRLYQDKLYKSHALDFDDLLMLTVNIFELNPNTLERYTNHFEQVFIDEYQDTNRAQYTLVKLLTQKNQNICVVGDSDQSIYRWRGADIRNILNFEKDYKNCQVVTLEQNYRSTQKILEAANALIANNSERKAKNLWTAKSDGENITAFEAQDEHQEAHFVAKTISNYVDRGADFKDFAVFYRVNAQSRVLEEAFLREGLPYKIIGGLKFYERLEIKDIMAYLRVLVNPNDSVSLQRIINKPRRGIGDTTIAQINKHCKDQNLTFMEGLKDCRQINSLSNGTVLKINEFLKLIDSLTEIATPQQVEARNDEWGIIAEADSESSLRGALATKQSQSFSLANVVEKVLHESGYLKGLRESADVDSQSRLENINEFMNVVKEFENRHPDLTLPLFLEEIALINDVDQLGEDDGYVTIMTMHNAKGLEFEVVFVIGMEEGLFPHFRSLYETAELEEERRLCYVSITRARKKLFLSSAYSRNLYGSGSFNAKSRFLAEIPMHLLEAAHTPTIAQFEASTEFSSGDIVEHKKFGRGTIVQINEEKVTIQFQAHGLKTLLIGYAPLALVE